jgi:hypothetical protein
MCKRISRANLYATIFTLSLHHRITAADRPSAAAATTLDIALVNFV